MEFRASALGRSTHYTLKYDYTERPFAMGWTMLTGDIQRSIDGVWRFDPDQARERSAPAVRCATSRSTAIPLPGFVDEHAGVPRSSNLQDAELETPRRGVSRTAGQNRQVEVAGPTRHVGIDVGGTKAQGVALDLGGNVVAARPATDAGRWQYSDH